MLLNLWATWCPPCRKEMPALDRLQAALGGSDFEVVALSIDRAGVDPVRRFSGETGVERMAIYLDSSGRALPSALRCTHGELALQAYAKSAAHRGGGPA